jgi:hypothetical protein
METFLKLPSDKALGPDGLTFFFQILLANNNEGHHGGSLSTLEKEVYEFWHSQFSLHHSASQEGWCRAAQGFSGHQLGAQFC